MGGHGLGWGFGISWMGEHGCSDGCWERQLWPRNGFVYIPLPEHQVQTLIISSTNSNLSALKFPVTWPKVLMLARCLKHLHPTCLQFVPPVPLRPQLPLQPSPLHHPPLHLPHFHHHVTPTKLQLPGPKSYKFYSLLSPLPILTPMFPHTSSLLSTPFLQHLPPPQNLHHKLQSPFQFHILHLTPQVPYHSSLLKKFAPLIPSIRIKP